MKKSIKLAMAASVLTAPAMAAGVPGQIYGTVNNMENPLYLPSSGMFYSKLSNGVMLKVADDSKAHKMKNHDGEVEFPIIRIQEEMGYGITDRWAAHFSVQYTHDDDIGRTGLSAGRVGTTYRLLKLNNGFVWDVYGDLHLGGIGEMRGQYNIAGTEPGAAAKQKAAALAMAGKKDLATAVLVGDSLTNSTGVLDYDNYSNGMWGFHVGTKVGKVWDKLTTSAFVEVLRTFGDDNNTIRLVGSSTPINLMGSQASTALMLASMGAPSQVSAELKSTTEVNAGVNAFYQWTSRWSTGAWFRYNQHASQGVEKITTHVATPELNMLKSALEQRLSDMEDGFDEYIIGLSVAAQMTEHAQVALYGEYTFDTVEPKSQNGTDVKAEVGVRVNFTF